MTQRDYVRTRREDVRAIPAGAEKLIKRMTKAFMRINVAVYKKSGGRFMGSFLGRPICIVTMTGRKTGKRYEIPLMYVPYGEQQILVASMGGASKNPTWFYNLKANPDISIQAKGETRTYRAHQVSPEKKAELWPTIIEAYPPYDAYQARTDRDIPVFLCDPV
jgi:deazaflavin-dependent oxidoreductase (nitroreductase family)